MTAQEYRHTPHTKHLTRAAIRPLRRFGAAGLALAAAVALIGTPMAQAATLPPAFLQATQAIATAHSYKMTMDTTSGGAYPSSSHFVAIFIRNGKTLSFEATDTTTTSIGSAKKSTTYEIVLEGARVCTRGLTGASWSCSTNTAMASAFENIGNLGKITATTGTKYSLKVIGQKSVQGQECTGYMFTSTSATSTANGVAWISVANHFLIEEDATTSTVDSTGAKPTPSSFKLVISNYNDPSLSIPKV